jgi:hypothetical protein
VKLPSNAEGKNAPPVRLHGVVFGEAQGQLHLFTA